MNFALACLVLIVVGGGWTAIGLRLWCGPSLVDEVERHPETRARRAMGAPR